MKAYRIFLKGEKSGKVVDLKIIREGFNFFAFLFNVFYLFYNKLWKVASLFFVVYLGLVFMPSACCMVVGGVIISSYISIHFIDWKSEKLIKDGYEFLGIFNGNNEKEAKEDFLKKFNDNYKGKDRLKQKIF
ncbi:MAG TPA: DUF2628 domain-containing protein [Rickettsiales bacterium]|nr:DUF2628 domain-containing protein [Rickettsiales bacterium]